MIPISGRVVGVGFPSASDCMPSTTLASGDLERKREVLLWRSGAGYCVVLLVCCDLLLVIRCLERSIPRCTKLLTPVLIRCSWFGFLLRRGSFGVLLVLAVWVLLLENGGGRLADFTGLRTLTALEKFELADEMIVTLSTSGFWLFYLPSSTFVVNFDSGSCALIGSFWQSIAIDRWLGSSFTIRELINWLV